MNHSKLPTRKLTDKLVADFQTELDHYTVMTPYRVEKITSDESMNLAKLGHGIPISMISGQPACKGLLRKFLDVGGPYQLREFIQCDKNYKQFNYLIRSGIYSN